MAATKKAAPVDVDADDTLPAETGTQLTVQEQATQSMAVTKTADRLKRMVKKSANIQAITNKAGYDECHAARMQLRSTRVAIEKRGAEVRDDALKFQRAVIAEEKKLVDLIKPEEERLAALQKAVDDRKAEEKRQREEAERAAAAALHERFQAIRGMQLRAVNATAASIEALIVEAQSIGETTFPDDHQAAAKFERGLAVAALKAALDARLMQDEREAQLARDLAELEQLRATQRQQQEQQEREAEERNRAENERQAREREQQERERREREADEKRQRDEEERVRQEQLARDREELAERERVARAEAVRLATERDQLEKQREADAIASTTLLEAAAEALKLLQELVPGHLATKKLAAALQRES